MERESTNGKTVEVILDSTNTIKNMGLVPTLGLMVANTSDNGPIAKDTGKGLSFLSMAPKDKAFGRKIKEFNG